MRTKSCDLFVPFSPSIVYLYRLCGYFCDYAIQITERSVKYPHKLPYTLGIYTYIYVFDGNCCRNQIKKLVDSLVWLHAFFFLSSSVDGNESLCSFNCIPIFGDQMYKRNKCITTFGSTPKWFHVEKPNSFNEILTAFPKISTILVLMICCTDNFAWFFFPSSYKIDFFECLAHIHIVRKMVNRIHGSGQSER